MPELINTKALPPRFTASTPGDLQTQLSTEESVAGAVSEVGSDLSLLADPDDDYTPLDPAYLPPGLEDDGQSAKNVNVSVFSKCVQRISGTSYQYNKANYHNMQSNLLIIYRLKTKHY